VIDRYGGPEVLHLADLRRPEPGTGQVRIRMAGAAVNPTDLEVRAGQLTGWVSATFPWILGWDVAGTVDAVGDGASPWRVGEPVVAMWDQRLVAAGSYAEHVVLSADLLAPAPSAVDQTTAAALPLASVTATQALDALDLPSGSRLLVTGASGIVGGMTAQLGVHRGLDVTGTVRSEADFAAARQLGIEHLLVAGQPVPVGGFDAVVRTAGPSSVIDAVRDGGRYLSIATDSAPPPQRGIEPAVHYVTADAALLGRMSQLVDRGVLTLRVARTMPLSEAGEAHRRQERGGLPGRIVLVP
jgi:NADPH:quinone reductase-like Zn-dependent oxidoreductase